ncbi:MAG TPA: hypothetical protein HA362_07050 [Nanoarchaeota archaeon]|nr:hypothetical protein [Nanoarchaeota archaeon]
MKDYLIRKAEQEDVERIIEIAQSRLVSSSSNETTGLIDYPIPSAEKYSRRISQGLFYVAYDDSWGYVAGFMDIYRDESLKDIFGEDPVVNAVLEAGQSPIAYINTLAVAKEFEGIGLPSRFFSRLEEDLGKSCKQIWAAIVLEPLRNKRSAAVLSKAGFTFEEEIRAFERYTFGLYKKLMN